MLQSKRKQIFVKYYWVLGILPALLFFLVFFVGGFLQALWISFENDLTISPQYTQGWAYKELINVTFVESLGVTLGIAIAVSLLAGIISLGVSLFLAWKAARWPWIRIIFQLPIGIPHLMAAYMLTQVFMQSGWYSRVAYHLGWIDSLDQFPVIIHDDFGIGVVFAYLWKEIPFLILLIYPFIEKLLAEWKETSQVLGATFPQMIRWIVIPLLFPIWVGGMWVVFAFTLGAYEIPALLGRTSLGSIPVISWQEYTQFGLERQKVAIAMNIVLAVISLIVGVLLIAMQRRWYEKGRRLW